MAKQGLIGQRMTEPFWNAAAQCAACAHHIDGTLACTGFPGGIPQPILAGRRDHRKPYPGDHGIRFEAR